MPELPEVETVRIGLSQFLPGKRFKAVSSDNPKSFPNSNEDVRRFLYKAAVKEVKRRAKVLIIDLDSEYSLVIHMKMTGQLVFVKEAKNMKLQINSNDQNSKFPPSTFHLPPSTDAVRFGAGHPSDSLVGELPDRSTRVIFEFTDGSKLFFNDQRKFGWIRLLPTIEVSNIDFFKKVGPEPLAADFSKQEFRGRFKRRAKTSIKAALLDQTVIAGVGNIYADEALWGAKINPASRTGILSTGKLDKLYEELRTVLELSIEKGGSTDRNYVDAEGKKGSYLKFAKVFRREGLACPRCATTILKNRVAGRGTHYCPKCPQLEQA